MLKKLLSLAVICTALNAHANIITDLISSMENYDATTLAKAPLMFKDENVGMEVFRASGIKNNLYQDGCGVELNASGGFLGIGTTYTIQGFYNGNFDVKMNNALVTYTLNGEDNPGREYKPDGTPGEYAGEYLSITPCIVVKDIIYIPLDLSGVEDLGILDGLSNVMGFATTDDASGLDNLHFEALTVPNLAENLLTLIPDDVLANIVKVGVNSQLENETIKKLVGGLIDRIVGTGEYKNYLSLLDDAKLNAMQLQIYEKVVAEDGTVTKKVIKTENFNGYELHSIKSSGYITDRVINDVKLGYGAMTDNDPVRKYKFAYTVEAADENGNQPVKFYNFDNAGMAIHTEVLSAEEAAAIAAASGVTRRFRNSLHPVTGYIDETGHLVFDNKQMLGCGPILDADVLGGYLNSVILKRLTPCSVAMLDKTQLRPVFDISGNATVQTESSFNTPVHSGSDTWSSLHGGTLKTMPSLIDINVGAYCSQNASLLAATGYATDLRTTDRITYGGEMQLSAVMPECTHEVALELTRVGFESDDNRGLYVVGTIIPGDNAQFVDSYDLMIVPKNVSHMDDVNADESIWLHSEKGLEHGHNALIGAKKVEALVAGPEYDVHFMTASPQSLSDNLSFEKLVPYTDIKKVTSKKSWGITTYEIVDATETDEYTFYVRTNYLPESGLAPSFHALTPKSVYNDFITGVTDIAVDGDDSDASAVYYDLQGVQLPERPTTPGLYIERQGKTSQKVYIR